MIAMHRVLFSTMTWIWSSEWEGTRCMSMFFPIRVFTLVTHASKNWCLCQKCEISLDWSGPIIWCSPLGVMLNFEACIKNSDAAQWSPMWKPPMADQFVVTKWAQARSSRNCFIKSTFLWNLMKCHVVGNTLICCLRHFEEKHDAIWCFIIQQRKTWPTCYVPGLVLYSVSFASFSSFVVLW